VAEVRAVAVTMSTLLRDIVTAMLSEYVAVEVVAVFDTRAESERVIGAMAPDLILIGLEPGESDEIASLMLARAPSARVVAFSHDGRQVCVHAIRRHRKRLLDASPQEVVGAILGIGARRQI
jgi:chemotaxis response regulator CheB